MSLEAGPTAGQTSSQTDKPHMASEGYTSSSMRLKPTGQMSQRQNVRRATVISMPALGAAALICRPCLEQELCVFVWLALAQLGFDRNQLRLFYFSHCALLQPLFSRLKRRPYSASIILGGCFRCRGKSHIINSPVAVKLTATPLKRVWTPS